MVRNNDRTSSQEQRQNKQQEQSHAEPVGSLRQLVDSQTKVRTMTEPSVRNGDKSLASQIMARNHDRTSIQEQRQNQQQKQSHAKPVARIKDRICSQEKDSLWIAKPWSETTTERQNLGLDSVSTHCNENPICVFPEKELHGLSPNFNIRVSVSN